MWLFWVDQAELGTDSPTGSDAGEAVRSEEPTPASAAKNCCRDAVRRRERREILTAANERLDIDEVSDLGAFEECAKLLRQGRVSDAGRIAGATQRPPNPIQINNYHRLVCF